MPTLVPCAECGRHVVADAPSCPFCDAALPPPPRGRALAGHLSRAAVLAGALAACGGTQTPAQGGQLPAGGPDAGSAITDTMSSVPDAAPVVQPPDDPPDDWRQRRRNCDRCPYGAPTLPYERVIA